MLFCLFNGKPFTKKFVLLLGIPCPVVWTIGISIAYENFPEIKGFKYS